MAGLTVDERGRSLDERIGFQEGLRERRIRLWNDPDGISGGLRIDPSRWIRAGLSESDLGRIQGESERSLSERLPAPRWVRDVEEAHLSFRTFQSERQWMVHCQRSELLWPLAFLIDQFDESTRAHLKTITTAPAAGILGKRPLHDFVRVPAEALTDATAQVCASELHLEVMRRRRVAASGSGSAFTHFFDRFLDVSSGVELLESYPALARAAVMLLTDWRAGVVEFFERLVSDAPLLQQRFGISSDLASVDWEAGDRHDGGRRVAVLSFEDGQRIVYKPRPMDIGRVFGELIDLTNRWSGIQLRAPRVLPRPGYGWSEFIEQRPCRSLEEAREFFRRQGALLAVLHFPGATDMHYENVVAQGSFPMCIDLETTFQPSIHRHPDATGVIRAGGSAGPDSPAESLRDTGLLPTIQAATSTLSVDVSALTGEGGRLSRMQRPVIEGYGTAEMRVVRASVPLKPSFNLPTAPDISVHPAADFVEEVVEGFCDRYRVMAAAGSGSYRSLESALARATARYVLRPTALYLKLIAESWHPLLLRDGLDRSFYWEALAQVSLEQPIARDWEDRVIAHEVRCLENSNVPVFRCSGDRRHLLDGAGHILIRDFFDETAVEALRRRLAASSSANMSAQSEVIRESLRAGRRSN